MMDGIDRIGKEGSLDCGCGSGKCYITMSVTHCDPSMPPCDDPCLTDTSRMEHSTG